MRLTLLGTASAEGLPALFCNCPTCLSARSAGGRNIRTRSSALINDTLKIDFPPDVLTQALRCRVDMARVTDVLITHGHDDHFCASELQYRGRYFVDQPIDEPLAVHGPRDVIDKLTALLDPDLLSFSLHLVEPEWPFVIGDTRILPIMAHHDSNCVCLNYVLETEDGASLLYATDTGWYDESTWSILETQRLDGIVVECTQREEGGYSGHLSIPEVFRMCARLRDSGALAPTAPVIATHVGHLMGLLHDELDACLRAGGVQAGYDGMQVEIGLSH